MQVKVRFSRPVAEEAEGSVLLMETGGTNELAPWLAGYGGTVEVLEPVDLWDAVRGLGRTIVGRYDAGSNKGNLT